jgi:hypothetical protein
LVGIEAELVSCAVFEIAEELFTLTRAFEGDVGRTNTHPVFYVKEISISLFNIE